jgi:hypothetical protein
MKKPSWRTYRSQLPRNWIQEVQKLITNEGFSLSETQIRDIRIGKIIDPNKAGTCLDSNKNCEKPYQAQQKKLLKLKALN